MLLTNLDIRARLVNGSTGIVCGYSPVDLITLPIKLGSDDLEMNYIL